MSCLRAPDVARARAAGTARRGTERVARRLGRSIDHELEVIEQLGFPGYFLIVWDIVEFCRRADIFCQGRGSAANSAVCYALGITNADAVSLGLLFERFLSPERDGPPDIDIDIECDRREEVIQYVYERLRARPRRPGGQRHHLPGAVGGARHGQGARLRAGPAGRVVASRSTRGARVEATSSSSPSRTTSPPTVLELAAQVEDFPRHLGIHSGGMVHLRPAGHRGLPGRVGAHGGPQRAAVGQGRLRGGRAW